MNREWKEGFIAGIPIFLGYLSVSFGIGILASGAGMTVWEAVLMSAANLTSAGQVAGIEIIAQAGSVLEVIATQFVINLRYALMALSLSQKIDDSFHTPQRLAASFGITDEIFALCIAREKKVSPGYMGGIIVISASGWVLGTFLGAAAGEILPASLTAAMGIMLYGMFVAIVLPVARKSRRVMAVSLIACAMSCLFRYVFTAVSSGFAVIICAIASSVLGAAFFPAPDEEMGKEDVPGTDAASDSRKRKEARP
ncbi:MAG: AzlC family ABC transporter permease [Bilifractor sp.]